MNNSTQTNAESATTPSAHQALKVLAEFVEFVKAAPVESGVCMCGDSMDGHRSRDHSAVDMWDHSVRSSVPGVEKALADLKATLAQEDVATPAAEAVAFQVRRTDRPSEWENCSKELFDNTQANGRYNGYENGPPSEVRALVVQGSSPAAPPGEVERLRNERDFLVQEYERAVQCGPQGYLHCAQHLFNAIENVRIDAKIATEELAASRATAVEPMQPLAYDENGTLRFRGNTLVRHLLDHGGLDLNDLAMVECSTADREHFAQLIGYSLGGFGDLSYVSDETYDRAAAAAPKPPTDSES